MQLDKPPSKWDEEFFGRWFQNVYRRDLQNTAVRTITVSDTVDILDSLVRADATAGNITVTLPTIRGQFGRPAIGIKKIDASVNIVTLAAVNTTFTAEASTDNVYTNTNDFDQTGIPVQLTNSGGTLPAGLSLAATYFTIYVSPKVIRLATTLANAKLGTPVNITGAGTGTHTIGQLLDGAMTKVFTEQGTSAQIVPTEALTWDIMPPFPLTIGGVAAGGDLSGTYPNPTVAKINGVALGSTTATSGNLLIGSGTVWVTQPVSGDITLTSAGVTAIGANKVTLAQMAQVATASVLGRNTAGTGNVEVLSAATTKTLLSLNNVENTALSTWAGSANITAIGTLVSGTVPVARISGILTTGQGGTGQDWSASSGIPLFAAGTALLLSSTGTGNVVRADSPTFTTLITTPAINGGTAANDDITIQGTTSATRTTSYVNLQPNGGHVAVGTTSSSGVAAPQQLNLGGTFGNSSLAAVSLAKLKIYDDGTNYDGISLASFGGTSQMEYMAHIGVDHAFYINNTEVHRLTGSIASFPSAITLKFGTHSAVGVETVTGYITVQDAAGNSRKLAVLS